ncbi:MAG TPA: BatA domain-containing protein [Chitinophagaceae bacterium]|nr:BatA domain-containing protein [Chitinophagaceae bacterium]
MNFLYPFFLIAGIAIVAPIIIHLFNFKKYKKVFFPDIRFLKEIQEQTQKSSKLKHLLVLLSRIAAILFLVAAFAQPFFSKDKEKISNTPKAISIYIDNSFSMGIEKNGLSVLDIAKTKASEVIQKLNDADKVQILTNDFGFGENRFLEKNEALRFLSTISISPISKSPYSIIEKQKLLLSSEAAFQKQIIYISDFQKSSFPAQMKTEDSIKKFFVIAANYSTNNISIDTAYFETPAIAINEENPLKVKIKNNSEEEVSTTINLNVNNQLKSVSNVHLKPKETKYEVIQYTPSNAGSQNIALYLNDYPMTFDDTFYVSAKLNASYSVAVLNQSNSNPFLSAVFRPNLQFKSVHFQVDHFNLSLLSDYSLVILNSVTNMSEPLMNALNQHLNNGGNVLCFAPTSRQLGNINSFLNKCASCSYAQFDTSKIYVSSFAKSHELFKDLFVKIPENIDLPIAYHHYEINSSSLSGEQKLFSFSNGTSFLSSFSVGNGKLYLCASSAESNASTFPKSYWFLPLIYKMAYSAVPNTINALTINKNPQLLIPNNKINDKTVYHLVSQQFDAIPEQRTFGNKMLININNAITQAGFYTLKQANANDTLSVAINYDRDESDLSYWNIDELKKMTHLKNAEWINSNANISETIFDLQNGIPLWKVCISLVLLFLLIEMGLIRFMK